MVQVRLRVGTAQYGSINAVSGSGIASMSEASMLFQPRMEEPSKPRPSAKASSVSSLMGMLKCCQVPKVSTNFMSTIFAPLFFAIQLRSWVCSCVICLIMVWFFNRRAVPIASCTAAAKFMLSCGLSLVQPAITASA